MARKNKIYGMIATLLGAMSIPMGYFIWSFYLEASLMRLPDVKQLAFADLTDGLWIVVASHFIALEFFIIGLALLIKDRRDSKLQNNENSGDTRHTRLISGGRGRTLPAGGTAYAQ